MDKVTVRSQVFLWKWVQNLHMIFGQSLRMYSQNPCTHLQTFQSVETRLCQSNASQTALVFVWNLKYASQQVHLVTIVLWLQLHGVQGNNLTHVSFPTFLFYSLSLSFPSSWLLSSVSLSTCTGRCQNLLSKCLANAVMPQCDEGGETSSKCFSIWVLN